MDKRKTYNFIIVFNYYDSLSQCHWSFTTTLKFGLFYLCIAIDINISQ